MRRRLVTTTVRAGFATAAVGGVAFATPGVGVVGKVLASGVLEERIHIRSHPQEATRAIVQEISLDAGGRTSWHTHPGPVVGVVKSGTFTLKSERHGTYVTKVYEAGESFARPGREPRTRRPQHRRRLRRAPGDILNPADTNPRIDMPAPEACAGSLKSQSGAEALPT